MDSLKELCEQHLITEISLGSAMALYQLATMHNADLLQEKVLEYMERYDEIVLLKCNGAI